MIQNSRQCSRKEIKDGFCCQHHKKINTEPSKEIKKILSISYDRTLKEYNEFVECKNSHKNPNTPFGIGWYSRHKFSTDFVYMPGLIEKIKNVQDRLENFQSLIIKCDTEKFERDVSKEMCSICLNSNNNFSMKIKTKCGHIFHKDCLLKQIKISSKYQNICCSICRQNLL